MSRRVAVIGSGLAGLSAAFHLHEQGYQVSLYRDAPEATWSSSTVVFGFDQALLALLEAAGHSSRSLFAHPLSIQLRCLDDRTVAWPRPLLPSPFHTLVACLLFQGMPLRDRLRLLSWIERTWEKDPALPLDLDTHSAEVWLRGIGQSETARAQLWTPVSRFLLGDDPRIVSAAAFLAALIRHFFAPRRQCHAAALSRPLASLLLQPLADKLRQDGVDLHPPRPIRYISFDAHRATGIQLEDGKTITADWYVLALPPDRLTSLLPERAVTRFSYFQQLSHLHESVETTVRFSLSTPVGRPRLVLQSGKAFHWITVTGTSEQTDVALTVTNSGGSLPGHDSLIARAREELGTIFSREQLIPAPVVEQRTFLTIAPGTAPQRPLQQSPFFNFFLVGEWTDTGLAANVESAALSGLLCAKAVAGKTRSREGGA